METLATFLLRFSAIILSLAISSCAVTTDSTESSWETFANTSGASSDFTSSTSPGSTSGGSAEKVRMFARINFDRLRTDMAVGDGEYLASFAALLGISDSHQAEFFALTKEKFNTLFVSEQTSPDEMLSRLGDELSTHPDLRR